MRQLNFIYPLGVPGLSSWNNNELRYSLRSLVDFNPNWIGITGPALPDFVCGVVRIYSNPQETNRYKNVQRQLLDACNSPDVPEELILMNDDFILRNPALHHRPEWDWTPTHMGLIPPPKPKRNNWRQTIEATGRWLREKSVYNALNYEGHTPFPFLKSKMKGVLEEILGNADTLQLRSAYGNLMKVGGKQHPNAKREDPDLWTLDSPFWSLKGTPTPKAIKFLEKQYPNPSPWEVSNV